jgi:hypothetical protein
MPQTISVSHQVGRLKTHAYLGSVHCLTNTTHLYQANLALQLRRYRLYTSGFKFENAFLRIDNRLNQLFELVYQSQKKDRQGHYYHCLKGSQLQVTVQNLQVVADLHSYPPWLGISGSLVAVDGLESAGDSQ